MSDTAEQAWARATFFKDGRLAAWPRKIRAHHLVLQIVLEEFAPGEVYPERAVNGILQPIYDDYCFLRRMLIDYRYMRRDHGIYERLPPDPAETADTGAA